MTEKNQESTTSLGLCEKLLMNWQAISPGLEKEQLNVYINILKTYRGLEQQYRIMLEAVKLLPFYEYKKEPKMPVFVFEKYESRKDEINALSPEKRTEYFKKLYMNKEASEYFKQRDHIRSTNMSNAQWLEQMIECMKAAHDEIELPKVIATYNRYPEKIDSWRKKIYRE